MDICRKFRKFKAAAYYKIIDKTNQQMKRRFQSVPFADRIIFSPHCMRNTKICKAREEGSYYMCAECGGCKLSDINKAAKELGYKKMYIMKGGKAIYNLLEQEKPKAIIGIACHFEGVLAIKLVKKTKTIVQVVPLSKDGCCDTDVNLQETLNIINLK